MANIRDVARAAGVGIGTVSRALNDSGYVEAGKKEKIRRIAKELNYRPSELSRSFVQKKERTGWDRTAGCGISVLWGVFKVCRTGIESYWL